MHVKHASSWSSVNFFFLHYVPVFSVCCFSFVRWSGVKLKICAVIVVYTQSSRYCMSVFRFMVNLLFANIFVAVLNYYSALLKENYFCC